MVIIFAIICKFILDFIYRWKHYSLDKLSKEEEVIVDKNKKKIRWLLFGEWHEYGIKNAKTFKIK